MKSNSIRYFVSLVGVLLLTLSLTSCQKHSDLDYEDLLRDYETLKFNYEDLQKEYDILQEESDSQFMAYEDYIKLSDFANLNTFGYKGFYSTAYCVVLKTGGTTTIRIGYDEFDSSISYEADNYHCTADWGDWDEEGRAALILKGTSEGITYLTLSNDKDNRKFKIVVFVVE